MFLSICVVEIMYQVMGAYGYSIEHILMVDIIPDASVRKAMNEINAGDPHFLVSYSFYFTKASFFSSLIFEYG